MKKLISIPIASASIAIGTNQALAEVDTKIHKLYLDDKDYSGCVKTIPYATTASISSCVGLSPNAARLILYN